MSLKSPDVVWQDPPISRDDRARMNKHRSVIVWFTGLSGAGKSTLAHAIERRLHADGVHTYVLDGDNVRHGLCGDLSFSKEARTENIRRIGEVAKLFVDAGVVVLAAFISPFRQDRERVRNLVPPGDFLEVHCRCTVEDCEARDVKGLYKKAREGGIKEFTGISSPYEEPLHAELTLDTAKMSVDECVEQVLMSLRAKGIITA